MRKALPIVPVTAQAHGRNQFDHAVKEILESITGTRGGRVALLQKDATLDDVIVKVNEILMRLQDG